MKKSKTFARKVIAIVFSVMMLASSFTGVLTVFAKSTDDGHDSNLAANFMAWAETTDNQTCEALLDYVDDVLQKANIAPLSVNMDYVVVRFSLTAISTAWTVCLTCVLRLITCLTAIKALLAAMSQISTSARYHQITLGQPIRVTAYL